MNNLNKTVTDENNEVTVTINSIGTDLMSALLLERELTYTSANPAGDGSPYTILVCLGGQDLIYASDAMAGLTIQIDENGYQGAQPFVLSGYGEQDRSTFISRVNSLFDKIEGIVSPS